MRKKYILELHFANKFSSLDLVFYNKKQRNEILESITEKMDACTFDVFYYKDYCINVDNICYIIKKEKTYEG